MRARLWTFVALGLLVAGACAPSQPTMADEASLRRALVQQTLERALVDQELPSVGLLLDQGLVVLSEENLDTAWVQPLPGVNLRLMTPGEIQQRANEQGDFLYLRFDQIDIQGPDRAVVSLSNSWAVSDASTTGYLSGGGFTIEYSRQAGVWVGEISQLWIS